ncbi:MAG: hypothetical protein J0H94_08045 [Rhizobiales bacterium]|jgi:hypothetical protein|nr:hypothetical protein [Hyphomicrobiales bacterium]
MTIKVTVQGLSSFGRKLQARAEEIAAAVGRENAARLEEARQREEAVSMPMDESKRPPRGISMDQALARWSDPIAYAGMKEYEDAEQSRSTSAGNSPYELRHREFVKYQDKVERSFRQAMAEGRAVMSSITRFANGRRAVEPSLWDVLDLIFEFDEVNGDGRTYTRPEFFDPAAIPKNIGTVPAWLMNLHLQAVGVAAGASGFSHDPTYTHVKLAGRQFVLGTLQAHVVRVLHEAVEKGAPWVHGKVLLAQAGSTSSNIGTLFKSQPAWKELIDSDGKGTYRLRLPG